MIAKQKMRLNISGESCTVDFFNKIMNFFNEKHFIIKINISFQAYSLMKNNITRSLNSYNFNKTEIIKQIFE